MSSIILYTETLNDFLFAFSSIESTLNSDLKLLGEILNIFQSNIGRTDIIIYDLINIGFLNDLANGKLSV